MKGIKEWAQMVRDETYMPWRKQQVDPESQNAIESTEVTDEKQNTTNISLENSSNSNEATTPEQQQQEEEEKPRKKDRLGKYWTIVAAGTGLFSDGYVNNSIGSVNTMLQILYPKVYSDSPAQSNVSSIAFAGTVLGQLAFGWWADHHSRKTGILVSTYTLIVFTILCAGSWGAGGSTYGMLAALTAYRFFIGVAIGGEYAAGSTATAEASNVLSRGHRNRWFVLFTNFMIDSGFVVATFVPLVLLWIFKEGNLTPVWRLTLGLGAIPPLALLYLRTKFEESDQFKKNNMKRSGIPHWLALKYYGPRLIVVSLIWFIYDFSAYSFGIYSSTIINQIVPGGDLYKTFGWNVVLNLFYIPGSFSGAFAADYLGPRLAVTIGMGLQAIIGFAMASQYETLKHHIGGFVVVYGIFLTCGEFGAGDQIGLIASKTSSSSIRGQYYGIAAAMGKIGAFVGTYVFPIIIKNAGGGDSTKGNQAPFYVSSSLCLLACALALFGLPCLDQDAVSNEDIFFKQYLERKGFDTSEMGDADTIQGESATNDHNNNNNNESVTSDNVEIAETNSDDRK